MGAQTRGKVGFQQPGAAVVPADGQIRTDDIQAHDISSNQLGHVLRQATVVWMNRLEAVCGVTTLRKIGGTTQTNSVPLGWNLDRCPDLKRELCFEAPIDGNTIFKAFVGLSTIWRPIETGNLIGQGANTI